LSHAGPAAWNSSPDSINTDTNRFKNLLKTIYFTLHFGHFVIYAL